MPTTLEEEAEKADGASELLYRVADTQKEESVQGNLVSGTNQGADGWESSGGALSAVECQPDSSADPVSGVRWEAAAGGTLTRTRPHPGRRRPRRCDRLLLVACVRILRTDRVDRGQQLRQADQPRQCRPGRGRERAGPDGSLGVLPGAGPDRRSSGQLCGQNHHRQRRDH